MSSCLMVGAAMVMLAAPDFSLEWTHSVEKIAWHEDWRIEKGELHLVRAAVKGSGAGMEPGDGAVLKDGWWTWTTETRVPSLNLAASGATVSGWRFCADSECRDLGTVPGEGVTIAPCDQ